MMISHLILSIIPARPVLISSLVHYLLLTAGLLASFHFIRKPLTRLTLTIAWFFPSHFFVEGIIYQFHIQFSMFMVAAFFLSRFFMTRKNSLLYLSGFFVFLIINVWVLDTGLLPAIIILALLPFAVMHHQKISNDTLLAFSKIRAAHFIVSATWIIAGICFLLISKLNSTHPPGVNLMALNNFDNFLLALQKFLRYIGDYFLIKVHPAETIYFYSLLLFLAVLVFSFYRRNKSISGFSFFRYFFLLHSIAGVLVLLSLKHVLINDLPVRYFTSCYLSFTILS